MEAITPVVEYAGSKLVLIAEHQAEFVTLPALIFDDGRVLIEWAFTKEERAAIARGENLHHWIWRSPRCGKCGESHYFEPVMLQVTEDLHG